MGWRRNILVRFSRGDCECKIRNKFWNHGGRFGNLCIGFRMIGVYASVLKTKLTPKERLFCMIAYTPKATVQAAIGAIPLSMGLKVGDMALTVAVISILITAPFGAIMVDNLYKKLLTT